MNINKIIGIIFFVLFFGCGTKDVIPPFENSNQYFIDSTINKLNIGKELSEILDSTNSIILLPLEEDRSFNRPIVTMIEDQLITSLYQNNYIVLERESFAIEQLIKEGKDKYSLTFNVPQNDLKYDAIEGDVIEPDIKFIPTHLNSADIVIFYRILEVGIIYLDYPDDKDYEKREGLISLHIRVQNISNGEIIYANNLISKSSDLIETKYLNHLSSFHYSFFSYEYPIQEESQE